MVEQGYPKWRKKIAFIKIGSLSHVNVNIEQQLAKNFPDYGVETIDLNDLIKTSKAVIWTNYLSILRHYGGDILAGRRSKWDCFHHTPFIFRRMKANIRDRIAPQLDQYAFSLQTQSLYDASVDGLPHFVYTDHTNMANLYYPDFGKMKLFPRWNALEKTIYRNATKVFVYSNHVRRSLLEHYEVPPEKAVRVLVGSNLEAGPAQLENNDYRNKSILFIGVEWERKGGPLLVEAFQMVLKRHPDARLTIVGCSPQITLPNCTVVGRIPLQQVRAHYATASVFCLPTHVEPFGIVFIETMLHKIPVVAPNIGALPDFVENGKSGRLVTPNSVDELADALVDLLDHPEKCRAWGEAGYRAVKDRYTWDAVGQRIRDEINASLHQIGASMDCRRPRPMTRRQ